jgi:short-subunit dehydrogenase
MITGGTRGLGLALARDLAALGCRLVICARNERDLEDARRELSARGAEVLAIRCDVGDHDQVRDLVAQAMNNFGRIDILINNAGIISVGPLQTQDLEEFRRAMDVMFWGAVHPTLAVLPQMIERGSGRIANITSIGGKVAVPHLWAYGCAKFAAVGFSEGLRAEARRHGIKVTTVVPGLMRTGSYQNAFFKGKHKDEYTWFALSGNSPLSSVSAEHAARTIVDAVRHGDAEVIISPQAKALALFHGIFPGLTTEILALVNRFVLPEHGGVGSERRKGKQSETALTRSFLTRLGQQAAREYRQTG